jgi:hypothetical protein
MCGTRVTLPPDEQFQRGARPEYGQPMFDVGLVGTLTVWVAAVAWRALLGAPPAGPVRFAVVAAVSAAVHLGFHTAATAAPSIASAIALVLAGWTTFAMWCLWLSRNPSRGFREDDGSDESDGGGGRGPGEDPPGPDDGPSGDVDWDEFEREFAAYVRLRREPALD